MPREDANRQRQHDPKGVAKCALRVELSGFELRERAPKRNPRARRGSGLRGQRYGLQILLPALHRLLDYGTATGIAELRRKDSFPVPTCASMAV